MCFEFGSCFGKGRKEDYGGERPAHRASQGRAQRGNRRNGAHAEAMDEAGHKAYHNDGARKEHHAAAVADAGGHGRDAAYVQDKKAVEKVLKLPASHNKVGNDAGYTYTYTALPHEAASDHREKAAMDYHYPTATTNTTLLIRY